MEESPSSLHVAMYPWFAFGRMIPFLQIANKLANKGHRISFFIPSKTQPKLQHFNHFPNLITFVPITVPHVDGLPPGAQTTADISHPSQLSLIMTSMDRTEPEIASCLQDIKPNVIFFDFAHWVIKLANQMGITSIYYNVISAVTTGYVLGKIRELSGHDTLTQDDFMQPPPGFPSSSIKLHAHEAQNFASLSHLRLGNVVLHHDNGDPVALGCGICFI
ncbi:cyanidin 3-O-galactoside 2''-O-xylosyltransferase FGGT1-like [Cucumis melo]|uniref:Cyanidin 3-O-galactoside 2''-O-xylosyltransferase FGGT1-like n=1 Tax=Cucumis melo TaxID=3656 RepID=A0A1S4E0E1_CUCME|nr:cyanidin 3-O-galactoside 2''-O-xylosyltransferase FGGT1-like [Cucumis melo]